MTRDPNLAKKLVCVIGAGAKAAAIVARAAALGARAPDVFVLERNVVGAGWDGSSGFSDGHTLLCTPPEKDVGFPYESTGATSAAGPARTEVEIARRFSWSSFLVEGGGYGAWIDRGRPPVTHARWAEYLRWVFRQSGAHPVPGEATGLARRGTKWEVSYRGERGPTLLDADGVVVTGPGTPKVLTATGVPPPGRLLDSRTFFKEAETLRAAARHKTVAVIGAGGSAGAILGWLASALAGSAFRLLSVSSNGTLFLRGDGFSERRHFTDPGAWPELPVEVRANILSRTEEGVISAQNRAVIDRCDRLEFHRGRAGALEWSGTEFDIGLKDTGGLSSIKADYVVTALGFDLHAYVLDLLAPASPGNPLTTDLGANIGVDLSIDPKIAGPGLHVPGLAGLAQGPGFATLGCLGLLARRVLDPYMAP